MAAMRIRHERRGSQDEKEEKARHAVSVRYQMARLAVAFQRAR
jgi:hypothetical protein